MSYRLPHALTVQRPWITHDRIPSPGMRRALAEHRVKGVWLGWDNRRRKWVLFVKANSVLESYAYVMTLGKDGNPEEPGPWLLKKIDEMDTTLGDPAEKAISANEAHERDYKARVAEARRDRALRGESILLKAFNMQPARIVIGVPGLRR